MNMDINQIRLCVVVRVLCSKCDGYGQAGLGTCSHCGGYGIDYTDMYGTKHIGEKCPYCYTIDGDTTGTAPITCDICDGKGYYLDEMHFDFATVIKDMNHKSPETMTIAELEAFFKNLLKDYYPRIEFHEVYSEFKDLPKDVGS